MPSRGRKVNVVPGNVVRDYAIMMECRLDMIFYLEGKVSDHCYDYAIMKNITNGLEKTARKIVPVTLAESNLLYRLLYKI